MEQKLRLTENQKKVICNAFKKHFGFDDHLWVFGSRANPQKKGGDIDLYVETQQKDSKQVLDQKLAFVNELWLNLGEQKIDVVIRRLNTDFHLPIYEIAKQEGVQIV